MRACAGKAMYANRIIPMGLKGSWGFCLSQSYIQTIGKDLKSISVAFGFAFLNFVSTLSSASLSS